MRQMEKFLSALGWILCVVCLGSSLNGQSIWMDNLPDKAVSIEFEKPFFKDSDYVGAASSAWFLSGKFAINKNIALVAELPFAYLNYTNEYPLDDQSALGNPYLGVKFLNSDKNFEADIGIRLPLSPDIEDESSAALELGLLTEFVERPEAFLADVLPINLRVSYVDWVEEKAYFRVRGGPSLWLGQDGRNTELLMHYSAQIGYQWEKTGLVFGLSGIWWMDKESGATESNWHQLGIATNLQFASVQPVISLKMPLDESLNEVFDIIASVGMNIQLD